MCKTMYIEHPFISAYICYIKHECTVYNYELRIRRKAQVKIIYTFLLLDEFQNRSCGTMRDEMKNEK